MAFDQGIDFRATAIFVTDPTGCTSEIGTTANYPRTSAQGNTVGWEDAIGGVRNRSAAVDARLAGIAFAANGTPKRYRIDLPSSGWYRITVALGDQTTAQVASATVFDGTTVVSHIVGAPANGITVPAGKFFDACGELRSTAANWVSNEVSFVAFFSTTICRITIGDSGSSGSTPIAHFRVTDAVQPSPSLNGGVSFRAAGDFVTDPTNVSSMLGASSSGGNANYPHITAQGLTVGWEQVTQFMTNRSAAVDARLAGIAGVNDGSQANFRIDLPGAGAYQLDLAIGDATVAQTHTVELFDTSSSLGTIVSGAATTSGQFYDATGTLRTSAANWVSGHQQVTENFSTTILRLKCGAAAGAHTTTLAHVSITQLTGFNGTSSLSAAITKYHQFTAALAGTSTLTASVSRKRAIAPTLAGTSTLSATISTSSGVTVPIAVTFAGTSTLTASVVQTDYLNVSFDGVGQLYLGTPTPPDISVTLAGTSTLTAGLGIGVTLAGTSSLTASFKKAQFTVELHGEGHLSIFGDLGPPGMRLSQIVNEIAYVGDLPTVVLSQVTIEVARKRSGLHIWATSGKGFA